VAHGTAFIHSVIVQERRGMLRVWNLSLVLATFCLTILGTFLTRSGVVNSVHAFTQSSVGPWLLGFLAVVSATCLALIAWRADKLHAPGRLDSPVSREAAFLANNLLFTGLAFVVLLGTVFPLVAEALRGNQLAVGEPYFSRMTTPIGLGLLFLMAVAPALPWRATSGEVLRRRLLVPAYAGVAVMVLTLVLWTRTLATVLAFGFATFAVAAIIRETALAVRARHNAGRSADSASWLRSFTGTVRGNPRRYGGFVVHIGVICIAVALAAAGSFGTKEEARLRRGDSVVVGGYRVTFEGTRIERTDQKTSISADLELRKDGRSLGTYAPAVSTFPNSNQAIGTPSVRTGILEDVYLTIVSSPNEQGRITVGIAVNAMTLWLWIGGGFMAIGTIIAIGPTVRRRIRPGTAAPDVPPPAAPPAGAARPLEEEVGV
jgi:cytochrome c-type biogenesis protein CcmF